MIMDRLYGGVCYAGIDTDPELKYPKGAGRVAFSNQQSYIAAISARFVQLQHNDIDKRVSNRSGRSCSLISGCLGDKHLVLVSEQLCLTRQESTSPPRLPEKGSTLGIQGVNEPCASLIPRVMLHL